MATSEIRRDCPRCGKSRRRFIGLVCEACFNQFAPSVNDSRSGVELQREKDQGRLPQ